MSLPVKPIKYFMKFAYLIIAVCFIVLTGCGEEKKKEKTIYYIDVVTSDDSLVMVMDRYVSGKVSYLDDNNTMQLVPESYLTPGRKRVHYYKALNSMKDDKPQEKAIKYEISFNNIFVNDSIAYRLKKYSYSGNAWSLKSDMGVIKVFDYLSEFDKNLHIIYSNVSAAVLRNIAADSYGNR